MPVYHPGMETTTHTAVDLIRSLSVQEIQDRLEALEAESRALRVLLRAARQRERTVIESQRDPRR